jgi:16S rRNA (adenine1518-N6/adenine1519-N6)-dimethyltransferase
MPARQTQSYLRSLFTQRGISPRHRLGQNFLVDLNIHKLIVEAAEVSPDDVILEVGSGSGALTSLLASRGATVLAVELDPVMAELAQEAIAGLSNAQVLRADALAGKNTLNPTVVDHLRALRATMANQTFKLVANLPYGVATPVITNLLVHQDLWPALMAVTIQRELAERMIASPSTPAYGALSVLLQALAEVSIIRILPPSVFWPRPKVESAVVSIRSNAQRRLETNVPWFHMIVRKIFLHRRKSLRHVLSTLWPGYCNPAGVETLLRSLSLDSRLRAEALGVHQFLSLAHALEERLRQVQPREQREPT